MARPVIRKKEIYLSTACSTFSAEVRSQSRAETGTLLLQAG